LLFSVTSTLMVPRSELLLHHIPLAILSTNVLYLTKLCRVLKYLNTRVLYLVYLLKVVSERCASLVGDYC
jgi:hypothetical protein